jgi:hypothetical protein
MGWLLLAIGVLFCCLIMTVRQWDESWAALGAAHVGAISISVFWSISGMFLIACVIRSFISSGVERRFYLRSAVLALIGALLPLLFVIFSP